MEVTVQHLAHLSRMVLTIWTKVADVNAPSLQLHALGAFALRCVRTILALYIHACDCIVIEDELDRLRRHMAKSFVPHVHRSAQGDEVPIAVVAGIVPVWIQCSEPVNQVRAEGVVDAKVVDALVLLELELHAVVLHPRRVRAEIE